MLLLHPSIMKSINKLTGFFSNNIICFLNFYIHIVDLRVSHINYKNSQQELYRVQRGIWLVPTHTITGVWELSLHGQKDNIWMQFWEMHLVTWWAKLRDYSNNGELHLVKFFKMVPQKVEVHCTIVGCGWKVLQDGQRLSNTVLLCF